MQGVLSGVVVDPSGALVVAFSRVMPTVELRGENSIRVVPSHRSIRFLKSGGTREQHRCISNAGRVVRR